MGGELTPPDPGVLEDIMDFFNSILAFDPADIGRGIGDILDKVQTICYVILGIFILIAVLWILSRVFGGSGRG